MIGNLVSDSRLLEYDTDIVLYDERSPFQHIQIIHCVNFGNLLVLDDFQSNAYQNLSSIDSYGTRALVSCKIADLAESDLVYTESIICRGVENYAGKEILILGGGDGALLYELRKEKPKMITMIEVRTTNSKVN